MASVCGFLLLIVITDLTLRGKLAAFKEGFFLFIAIGFVLVLNSEDWRAVVVKDDDVRSAYDIILVLKVVFGIFRLSRSSLGSLI